MTQAERTAAAPSTQQWPAAKVQLWDIERLIPYARNAKQHSATQIAQLAASMREWGFTMPILAAEDGTIIAGHGRVMAARLLEWTKLPVMVAKGWTDAQRRAYVLADNRLAESPWDDELLAVELDALAADKFDMSLLGFTNDEMDALAKAGEFGPGTAGDQGDLSILQPIICPHCGGEVPRK
jgi:ParB-like chromosome segregation protein Spo0J